MRAIFPATLPPLKALAGEGLRGMVWLRGAVWLLAAWVLLSLLALIMPLPLRDPRFTLQTFAALDQLLVTFLVGAWLLLSWPDGPSGWWPLGGGTGLVARGLGVWAGLTLLLLPVVVLQYAGALAAGQMEIAGRLALTSQRLDGRYVALFLHAVAYGLVLLAWAQVFRLALPRGPALFCLLVSVFTGFILPDLVRRHPALSPLLGLLPDLGALAPPRGVRSPPGDAGMRALYVAAHAGATWALGAVVLAVLRGRGRCVERPAPLS